MPQIKPYRQECSFHYINQWSMTELVTVGKVKNYLNISFSDDDTLISDLILTAGAYISEYTNNIFSDGDVAEIHVDWFDVPTDGIYWIPVKVLGRTIDPATIMQEYDINDGADQVQTNPTIIQYGGLCGLYWPDGLSINSDSVVKLTAHIKPNNVPTDDIQRAVIIMAAHLYNNRDVIIPSSIISSELPFHLRALLDMAKTKIF